MNWIVQLCESDWLWFFFCALFLFSFRAEDTSMLVQILVWFSHQWHSVTSTPLVLTVF